MDTNECAVMKLFVVGFLVNAWMMGGLSATESSNIEPTSARPRRPCNESRLEWEVEVCGEAFKRDMAHIDPQYWCNLTHFISTTHSSKTDVLLLNLLNTQLEYNLPFDSNTYFKQASLIMASSTALCLCGCSVFCNLQITHNTQICCTIFQLSLLSLNQSLHREKRRA
ncbi:uncharacterized protein LOC129174034 isoform X1 [Dunckerocampus dactyliophorus]|uniref:uncharacterized protein LOC129174034 isoform X1 n=1 Tax=Dunckerocampus dactyliophorus TaxID=161453 RepID=UPI0024073072|nr:uncharacterized protein LOC129174034 isoform X1 [Dunckerocampus dactyliophorus]